MTKIFNMQIDYTSNYDKSGILSISDDKGKVIFSSNVILPKNLMQEFRQNGFSVSKEKIFKEDISSMKETSKTIFNVINDIGNEYIVLGNNIKITNTIKAEKVSGFKDSISLIDKKLENLNSILNKNDLINLEVVNHSWIWGKVKGLENIIRENGLTLETLIDFGKEKENQSKANNNVNLSFDFNISSEGADRLEKSEPKTKHNKLIEILNNKAPNQTKKEVNNYTKSSSQTNKNKLGGTSNNFNKQNIRKDDDGLDMVDVMFMNAFPDMAPFYKPNSILAWYLYFSNSDNHNKILSNPYDEMRKIDGFKDIEGCRIVNKDNNLNYCEFEIDRKNESGELYKDKVIFNNGQMNVMDNKGNEVKLIENDGKYIASFLNDGGSNGVMELESSRNGLSGSFFINPKNGIAETLDISLNNDLVKDISKDISTQSVVSMYESSMDSKFEKQVENNIKEDYIPPPPPPPEYNSYGTSDPYSYTSSSSFGM